MTVDAVRQRVWEFMHTDWERCAVERRLQKGLGDGALKLPRFLQEWVERENAGEE